MTDTHNPAWSKAFHWLNSEAQRLGWAIYKPVTTEQAGGAFITGRICKILELREGRARISKNNALQFRLGDVDGYGLPSAYVRRAQGAGVPFDDMGAEGVYRVYHEYQFDARAVYPLEKLLASTTPAEAAASAWFDSDATRVNRRRVYYTFSWWHAFLTEEANRCTDPEKLREIRRILRGWFNNV